LHVLRIALSDHAPEKLPRVEFPTSVDLLPVLVMRREVVYDDADLFVVSYIDFLVEDVHHY